MKYKYLNLKYALINIFYMFLICSTVGYAANFLLAKGFSNSAVGAVLSCVSIFGVAGTLALPSISQDGTTKILSIS